MSDSETPEQDDPKIQKVPLKRKKLSTEKKVQIPNQIQIKKVPRWHVVEFKSRGPKPKLRKNIDVTATKWFRWDKAKKQLFTKYPPPPYTDESYADYNNKLALLEDAPADWKEYSFKVQGYSDNLKEALKIADQLLRQEKESALTQDSDGSVSAARERAVENIRKSQLKNVAAQIEDKYNNNAQQNKKRQQMGGISTLSVGGLHVSKKPRLLGEDQSSASSLDNSLSVNDLNNPSDFGVPIEQVYERSISTVRVPENVYERSNAAKDNNEKDNHTESSIITTPSHGQQGSSRKILSTILNLLTTLSNDVQELKSENRTLKKGVQNLLAIIENNQGQGKLYIGTVKQINQKFKLDIPFKNVEEFFKFDAALPTNKELRDAVANVLQTGFDIKLSLTKSLVTMLKLFLSKEVAKQFVASREVSKKFILGETNFYELIAERRKINGDQTLAKDLSSALTDVLSNAGSWYKNKAASKKSNQVKILAQVSPKPQSPSTTATSSPATAIDTDSQSHSPFTISTTGQLTAAAAALGASIQNVVIEGEELLTEQRERFGDLYRTDGGQPPTDPLMIRDDESFPDLDSDDDGDKEMKTYEEALKQDLELENDSDDAEDINGSVYDDEFLQSLQSV